MLDGRLDISEFNKIKTRHLTKVDNRSTCLCDSGALESNNPIRRELSQDVGKTPRSMQKHGVVRNSPQVMLWKCLAVPRAIGIGSWGGESKKVRGGVVNQGSNQTQHTTKHNIYIYTHITRAQDNSRQQVFSCNLFMSSIIAQHITIYGWISNLIRGKYTSSIELWIATI